MSHYDALLVSGWKMNDIDEMDFMGYIDVLLWRAKPEVKSIFVDDCPMFSITEVT